MSAASRKNTPSVADWKSVATEVGDLCQTIRQKSADPDAPALPPPPIDREELAYYVRHRLSREERLLVMLHYAEKLSFGEIAGILAIPEQDIERMHASLVARLKEALTCEAASAT